jgi:UDP-3-O-[3-hydroxymyristoyl] glucosamine N-acyltransferase
MAILTEPDYEPRGAIGSGCRLTLGAIAAALGGVCEGDLDLVITGIAGIREAERGQISFLANGRYQGYVKDTQAGALIVGRQAEVEGRPAIRVDDPYLSFLTAIQLFSEPLRSGFPPGISERAAVAGSARLGAGCHIGDFVHIGEECQLGERVVLMPGVVVLARVVIGDDCIIFPNVTLREDSQLGRRVIIHAGTVVGADGFGYAWDGNAHRKIPQIGRVELGDDVELGANVCIDRATTGVTRVAEGCKIDNLVQIAHNVRVGRHSIIVAQVGISGSTRIGENVKIAGQAGLAGHIEIGDRAQVGAQAGVTKSVEADVSVSGYPARPHDQARRLQAALSRLPDLARRVRELEDEVARLRGDRSEPKDAEP